jgi:uracil-DNA glycosylase family 4
MDETLRRQYLEAMGVQSWMPRDAAVPEAVAAAPQVDIAELPQQAEAEVSSNGDVATLDWAGIEAQVAACDRCELHTSRTNTVFGVGDRGADLLIIGEAPGADEDRQGEPFVGRAGQLLNAMLKAIGLERNQVFIANILKCRPPGNRDPQPDEVSQCEPYLLRQIELLQPKLILAVGRIAAQNLLATNEAVGRLRGREHQFGKTAIPLIVTYHPAYLLRSPDQKGKAWQDLQMVVRVLNRDRTVGRISEA